MFEPRPFRSIGKPLARKEDRRLITGKGRFTDDFSLPDQVWAAMVRSPLSPCAHHWHRTDSSEALAMPGVLGVYTGADCEADGLRPIPHNPVPSTDYDMKLTGAGRHARLRRTRIIYWRPTASRHVGEALAMVVAETHAQAQSAAETRSRRLRRYCPGSRTVSKAAQPGAPRLWDELPDNVLVDCTFGDVAETEAAFAAAAHIVSMRAITSAASLAFRSSHAPRLGNTMVRPVAICFTREAAARCVRSVKWPRF